MGDADTLQNQEVRHKNVQEIHETPEGLLKAEAPRESVVEKQSPFMYNTAEFDKDRPETWGKISRNDPCPCGSGLKYKHCHGKI